MLLDQMVLSLDLAPTLIDLGGQTVDPHFQGRSMVPLFDNSNKDWRSSFLIEYYSDNVFERVVNMGYKAVRTDRYKLIRYVDLEGMDEFYDLQDDPFELNNLINSTDAELALDESRTELDRLLRETNNN
jgi:N-acetylglucosamine-6-sulfatase